jgi:hypothetical protein
VSRVIVESPYAGDVGLNVGYLRACLHDCFLRGESPFASHGLYTQPGVLRDDAPNERELGVKAGFSWRLAADKTVVYLDLGISNGMRHGIHDAAMMKHEIEFRWLGDAWGTKAGEIFEPFP